MGLLLHVPEDSKMVRASSGKRPLSLLIPQDRCPFPERRAQAESPRTSQAAQWMTENFPEAAESKEAYRALTARGVQGSNCAYLYRAHVRISQSKITGVVVVLCRALDGPTVRLGNDLS